MEDLIRLVTLNVLTRRSADGSARHEVLRRELPDLQADVTALQEVIRTEEFDQAADLLGPEYTIVDVPGGDANYGGECLAIRCPIVRVETLDLPLDADSTEGGPRASAAAVEIVGPGDVGPLIVVHHKGTYELNLERVREQQAVATARFVEDLLRGGSDIPVILLGDLNADPLSAGVRFLTGKQSLDGMSVCYADAWDAIHRGEAGHTFDPRNPIVRAGQMPGERGRRIDYILVRSGPHGPLLDIADCKLIFTQPISGVWVSDHYGLLADLRRPAHPPGTWAGETVA